MLIYITLESGGKLIGAAYKDNDYLGLKALETGIEIEVTFKTSKSGLQRLTEVKQPVSYTHLDVYKRQVLL